MLSACSNRAVPSETFTSVMLESRMNRIFSGSSLCYVVNLASMTWLEISALPPQSSGQFGEAIPECNQIV